MLPSLRFLTRPAHQRVQRYASIFLASNLSYSQIFQSRSFATETQEGPAEPSHPQTPAKPKKRRLSKSSRGQLRLWDAASEEKFRKQLKQVDIPPSSKALYRAAKRKLRKTIERERKKVLADANADIEKNLGRQKRSARQASLRGPDVLASSRQSVEKRAYAKRTSRGTNEPLLAPTYSKVVEGALKSVRSKSVLQELPGLTDYQNVARLSHGLDRALFNPGVHWMQDPRSTVYNFSPYVQNIPDLQDFAFDRLTPFTPSSRDRVMRDLAAKEKKRFAGSTSSLSGLLSHIYFLISRLQSVNTENLAAPFPNMSQRFTPGQRMPSAVIFRNLDNVYMVDSDKTDVDDSEWNILCHMGTMLETFLTTSKPDFGKFLRSVSDGKDITQATSSYRYSKTKQFVMRSQLDCIDDRLPGTGVFDIKTRAVLPIRMDTLNFKANSRYTLNSQHGLYRSIDSEYYDLIRSAFLKYSFQARIGNMDGIFLAYHNTAQILGFQYLPLEVIDAHVFGPDPLPHSDAARIGWRVFAKCVQLLEIIASEIVDCFPGQTVTCLAETREAHVMNLWVQPVEESKHTDPPSNDIPEVDIEDGRPIIQLDVGVNHFIQGRKVENAKDVFTSREPWTMSYSVSRCDASEAIIRTRLESAKSRKYRPMIYPEGVESDTIRHFLQNIGFGDPANIPDLSKFETADGGIRQFRKMAKRCKKLKNQAPENWTIWNQTPYTDPSGHLSYPIASVSKPSSPN